VTAVYKGSKKGMPPALLRSYDSRKETAAEDKCTIWQAGRATSATALAFKPIQVGQSFFLDEGNGKYNPAPVALDEALSNEWPGREIGVFISIGTGKRPSGTVNQHLWWEGFVSSSIGDFAEARRRLIAKIEGCEETHLEMHGRLCERGVNLENYFRLNVEVGVGEFGMNEWNRLAEISTNTRMYLGQGEVQIMNVNAATKLARIWRHNKRWYRAVDQGQPLPDPQYPRNSWEYESSVNGEPETPAVVGAVELPAEDVIVPSMKNASHLRLPGSGSEHSLGTNTPPKYKPEQPHWRQSYGDDDKFIVHAPEPYKSSHGRQSSDMPRPLAPRRSHEAPMISLTPPPKQAFAPPPPPRQHSPQNSQQSTGGPPPIPPKTPLNAYVRPVPHPNTNSASQQRIPAGASLPPSIQHGGMHSNRPPPGGVLPYPSEDGPPPIVNMAKKPEFGGMR
jgi:hypothetical protein